MQNLEVRPLHALLDEMSAAGSAATAPTDSAGSGDAAVSQREAEEAAAVRALDNLSVALDNISRQLEPLFAVPWDTLVGRCVIMVGDRGWMLSRERI